MANSGRRLSGDGQLSASEDVSLHKPAAAKIDTTLAVMEVVKNSSDSDVNNNTAILNVGTPNNELHQPVGNVQDLTQLRPIVDTQQQQQCDNTSVTDNKDAVIDLTLQITADVVDDDDNALQRTVSPVRTVVDYAAEDDESSLLIPKTASDYRAKMQAEIREELPHPDAVFITEEQYKIDRDCAVAATRAHTEGITVKLQVARTTFHMSSFHFKDINSSMTLYNDPSGSPRRLEWVDFVRRSKDGYVLYLWDQRIAIMLNLKNMDTNTYQTRFFVAMTNLYMQLGDGSVFKDLVLLDILVRMDVHTHVDALVGVIATGEVRLWKHSQDHLRYLHCDFMHEIERGENYWIARRQQFYEDKGLLYLPQRMIPRDLDAPRSRFAVSKEYITHYKHVYNSEAEATRNFDKWTLLPGRFKSLKEYADQNKSTNSRHVSVTLIAERERLAEKAKQDAQTLKNKEANRQRQETRKRNQEEKKKEEERKLLAKHQHQHHAEKKAPHPPPQPVYCPPPPPPPPHPQPFYRPPPPQYFYHPPPFQPKATVVGRMQPPYGRRGSSSHTSKHPSSSSSTNTWDNIGNSLLYAQVFIFATSR